MDLRASTVVITGASDGIGRALAVALAARGANLVLAARTAPALEVAAQACLEAGAREALAVPTDVADPDACRALIATAIEHFGKLDVLVNNAGISMHVPVRDIADLSIFERVMRVNYLGAVYCTHAALPYLEAARGLVVAVSSLQGKMGFPGYSGYCASKHAMQGFFDSLRMELEATGVGVLVVSPGPVATDIHERRLGADGALQHEAPHARSGMMPAEECARQIARAIERRDRELVMTALGKLGVWLKLVAPGLVDRFTADAVRRFEEDGGARSIPA